MPFDPDPDNVALLLTSLEDGEWTLSQDWEPERTAEVSVKKGTI